MNSRTAQGCGTLPAMPNDNGKFVENFMYKMSSEIVVERVITLLESNIETDSTIIDQIKSEFQVGEDDAESIPELTRTGLFRAQIFSSGMKYPKCNLNDNPILMAALRIGLNKLHRPELYQVFISQQKPWWKFW